mmetsp:Transcript_6795/g.14744  ORF Transcript_6795/g.14744 Transcript_6795/m.14744 type:complete len:262 (-) Transcript_6795:100-885(-)
MDQFTEEDMREVVIPYFKHCDKFNCYSFGNAEGEQKMKQLFERMQVDGDGTTRKEIRDAIIANTLTQEIKSFLQRLPGDLNHEEKTKRSTIFTKVLRCLNAVYADMATRFGPPLDPRETELHISLPSSKRPRKDFVEKYHDHLDVFTRKNSTMSLTEMGQCIQVLTDQITFFQDERRKREDDIFHLNRVCSAQRTPAPVRRRRVTVARSAGSSSGGGCTTGSSSGGGCTTGDNGDDDDFDDDGTEVGDGGGSVADAIQLDM